MIKKIKNYLLQNTDYGKTRYLNYLYQYDLKQFYKNSLMDSNDGYTLATRIRLLSHAIEKGLSLPNPRQGFGKEKLMELIALDKEYSLCEIKEDTQIHDLVLATVQAYAGFQRKHNMDISFIPSEYTENKINSVCVGTKEYEIKANNFAELAHSRHSAREFSDKAVSNETILDVIRLAQTAPSACNRQSIRVYACTNDGKKAQIMSMHGGLKGFDKPGVIFAITGDLHLYQNEFERNTVFVDGGIFIMNLLYSLSSYGMLSCPIIWGSEPDMDGKLKALLDICDSHKIIALVVAGYPKGSKYTATLSPKRKTEDIVFIRQ